MNSRRILPLILSGAFIIAAASALLVGYGAFIDDPFGSTSEQPDDGLDGNGKPHGVDPGNETLADLPVIDEDTPGWLLPIISLSVLGAVIFIVGSGNLYLKSKRGENIVRADLLDLITINPGINLSAIRKELQLSQGAVSYHIMKLEKMGKIFSDKGSKERRYYPSSMGYKAAMKQAHLDEIESILSNGTSRNIVNLLKDKPRSQNEIVNELNVSPSTVHWHMERMKSAGLILKESRGRSVFYELTESSSMDT
jgi:predicted transcriptional regulator